MDQSIINKTVYLLSDYLGYQLGESVVQKKIYFKKDILYVIIGNGIYRFALQSYIDNMLEKISFFRSPTLTNTFIRDFVVFVILNMIVRYIKDGKKEESMSKLLLKSAIESATSNVLYQKIYMGNPVY